MTPVHVDRLVELLRIHEYSEEEIVFLEHGFRHGFDIGYEGPQVRQSTANNIPFTVGDECIMWNKIMKEVELGRMAGLYDSIPFENFMQSPISLVPKAGSDKTRLIFHLLYQFKMEPKGSLNFHTPKSKCTAWYRDIDYAVKTVLDMASSARDEPKRGITVVSGKTDAQSAFRILPLSLKS